MQLKMVVFLKLDYGAVSEVLQGSFKTFQISFKGVSRGCQACVKDVSWKFAIKCSWCFKEVSCCAWHSLQLPKQREGLFFLYLSLKQNLLS